MHKTKLAENLARLMAAVNVNANELNERTGVPQPTISRILKGGVDKTGISEPRDKTIAPLANYFGVTLAQLRGHEPLPQDLNQHVISNVAPGPKITGYVPLLNWVQAGQWREIEEWPPQDAELIPVTKRVSPRAYALRVQGDSMVNPNEGDSFPPGVIIICDPEKEAKNRSFVAVRLNNNNEATFKQLVIDGGRLYLKPLNPRYPIIDLQALDYEICGVVIQMTKEFD